MIYLDNAATSFPKPECVCDAVSNAIRTLGGNPGRSGHDLSVAAANEVFKTRQCVAELFGGKPENVVFTYNATYAINAALKSSYIYGTHILISDLEHNSVLRPTASVTGNAFASYSVFDSAIEKSGDERTHAVIASMRSRMRPLTRTVICTARSNITGAMMPIRAIGNFCRQNNLFFIVDAAQSAGYDDIDVERDNIDILCAPGHKGLYGPGGTGVIVFSEHGASCGRVSSFIEGGNGVSSLDINMPDALPEKLEGGTLGVPGISGLGAGIRYIGELGLKNISRHESELAKCAYMALSFNRNVKIYAYCNTSPMLLFNVADKDCEAVAMELNERGICVRAGYHCSPLAHRRVGTPAGGAVRMSVGYSNTDEDIDKFIKAVNEISIK